MRKFASDHNMFKVGEFGERYFHLWYKESNSFAGIFPLFFRINISIWISVVPSGVSEGVGCNANAIVSSQLIVA